MKRIWDRRDTDALAEAIRSHPASIHQQREDDERCPVIDLVTRRRLA